MGRERGASGAGGRPATDGLAGRGEGAVCEWELSEGRLWWPLPSERSLRRCWRRLFRLSGLPWLASCLR